jgi:hypothetical protein
LRAAHAELVHQLRVQVVLAHVLAGAQHACAGLHRAHVGAGADGCGAPHDVLLVRVLHQAHLVQHGAQVALLFGAQGAVAHARAHLVQPAGHALFEPLVDCEREPHGVAVLQQPRQLPVEFTDGEGRMHAERADRRFRAEPVAVPDLPLQVLGLAEQRAVAVAGDHQPGVRLGEAGQVIEVAVMAEQEVGVPVARPLRRRRNDRDAVAAELCRHAGTALGVERGGHGGVHAAILRVYGAAFSEANRSGVPTSVHGPW